MHEVVFPLPLIDSSIGELEYAKTAVIIALPLPPVDRSITIVVGALSTHFVLLPLSTVLLLSRLAGCSFLDSEASLAVLGFDSIDKLPVANVLGS